MIHSFIIQEEWISDEEFYTEGSSDEDDMALRIKQRDRREAKREKSAGSKAQISFSDSSDISETAQNIITDQDCDDSNMWRPTRGSFKLKNSEGPEHQQIPTNSTQNPTVEKHAVSESH